MVQFAGGVTAVQLKPMALEEDAMAVSPAGAEGTAQQEDACVSALAFACPARTSGGAQRFDLVVVSGGRGQSGIGVSGGCYSAGDQVRRRRREAAGRTAIHRVRTDGAVRRRSHRRQTKANGAGRGCCRSQSGGRGRNRAATGG